MLRYLLSLALFIASLCSSAQSTFCNTAGNIIIFTNYDGGTLNINIDQNIPNIKIGVVSYEAVDINVSGTYAGNVSEVRYAGYNSNNTNCSPNVAATTISAPGATTSITFAPPSTLSNTNGYSSIICGYSCNTGASQGGCNTVDQIEAYFFATFSSTSLYMHRVQYGCWSGTQNISAGGDCCASAIALSVLASSTDETCNDACDGTAEAIAGGGQSPYSFLWSNGGNTSLLNNLCQGTYTVTVTDGNGATITEMISVDSADLILTNLNLTLCNGESIIVGGNTYNSSGVYEDTLVSGAGCDSIVITDLLVHPAYASSESFTASECDDFSVTVGANTYSESGSYQDTLSSVTNCDSIVTTVLLITPTNLITQQPASATVVSGNNANFSMTSSSTSGTLQWQENSGTGFVSLSNAGQYSGSSTSALTISNTALGMNNYLYRCIVTEPNCTDTTDQALLVVKKPLGISRISNTQEWSVYPNPANQVLIIENHYSNDNTNNEFVLFDALGSQILSGTVSNKTSLDVSSFPSGLYFVVVKGNTTTSLRVNIVH